MPSGRYDYTVSQERVRMRDGVQLLTDVYVPAGHVVGRNTDPHPVRP